MVSSEVSDRGTPCDCYFWSSAQEFVYVMMPTTKNRTVEKLSLTSTAASARATWALLTALLPQRAPYNKIVMRNCLMSMDVIIRYMVHYSRRASQMPAKMWTKIPQLGLVYRKYAMHANKLFRWSGSLTTKYRRRRGQGRRRCNLSVAFITVNI